MDLVKMSVENVCSTLFYYLLPSLMCGERSGANWLPCITQVGATHWWWVR
uniref:Uncharacterized protein n=1 Tax=Anguilla anguilla TaxID=7936 RepID=A0A0E9Q7D1_ANGAN